MHCSSERCVFWCYAARTQLPLGQFPINPLELSLCCQGCAQKILWAGSPRFILGEWEDGEDCGRTLEGPRQRICIVHSLTLNTVNSRDYWIILQLDYSSLKYICISVYANSIFAGTYISFKTNLSLIFYCYSPKGHFDYYIKG